MDFPKKLLVMMNSEGDTIAGNSLADLGPLEDGDAVAVYGLRRIKKVEVTRKLVKVDPLDTDTDVT